MNTMSTILITINTLIFLFLSSLHVYWAFGGKWGSTAVIPTVDDKQPAFIPGKFITLVVASGLFLFALITIGNYEVFNDFIEYRYFKYAIWAIVVVFLLRAVGDFKQIGFSKKVKGTAFAKNDTKIYSPLCLYLCTSSFIIWLSAT